ncbi:putative tetracycline resistance protein [Streptomyces lydicamycinicus]|uniref:Putative tetracycline resistance protein n=1 Tax=Streptomyces lydicamycinicus TaxID=1546107 RepID=A0A0P4RBD6_9ACTN|nr:tetracycline resistance ribosomal protection protein Otr(A) [Streptomyces lydicamycinicus]GAO10354.1 putative tetracycline resistance protein [Streptomyces lydicamycinicus]
MNKKLNLGILAHVDAGKTSLTERLLHHTGAIEEFGSVDAGTTQTDSMELERRRGITIRSAVATFVTDGLKVNLIDTPGHSDFIAEVERALGVLDGVVLVVSAVEGVQPQTRILMRTLRRLRIPTLVFVNKIDRRGARYGGVLEEIAKRLTPSAVAVSAVTDIGTPAARAIPRRPDDPAFATELGELLSLHNDAFLTSYLDLDGGARLTDKEYAEELARQTADGQVYPVFFGSALKGEGLVELLSGIREFLPAVHDGEDEAPLLGTVFKVERGPRGESIAYLRLRSGSLATRDHVTLHRTDHAGQVTEHPGKITSLRVYEHGSATVEARAAAGDIAKVWGLKDVRIGDQAGYREEPPPRNFFAPPNLETVVGPECPEDSGRLHAALRMLSEQDPSIELRQDEESAHGTVLRLYGEVQKDIIHTTLAESFGVRAVFKESRTVCIEKPVGVGEALEEWDLRKLNYFWATVGLRVEPGKEGSGIDFRLAVERGSLPGAFHKAIEETVHTTLRHGLHGWQVTDVVVTLNRSGFASPVSAADDFRKVTPLVLMSALKQAGTQVYEPVSAFELEIPAAVLSTVLANLAALGATPEVPLARGDAFLLEGTLPAGRVHELGRRIPSLTNGEGVFLSQLHGHRPVSGSFPVRPRPAGPDPLDRDEYILHAVKRL